MKPIETNAMIAKDRILTLQLPQTREQTTPKEQPSIIISDPNVMGGTSVFAGTRVPSQTLIDYLKGGESIEDFLAGFPTVSREQVIAFLEQEPNRSNRTA